MYLSFRSRSASRSRCVGGGQLGFRIQGPRIRRVPRRLGGVPGGREAGLWVRDNVPDGATLMTIGPSMVTSIQYYGHRPAAGLSVEPQSALAQPVSYEPINNPDLEIRSGDMQYVVWDSFSAARSSYFSDRLLEPREPIPRTGGPYRDDRHDRAIRRRRDPAGDHHLRGAGRDPAPVAPPGCGHRVHRGPSACRGRRARREGERPRRRSSISSSSRRSQVVRQGRSAV